MQVERRETRVKSRSFLRSAWGRTTRPLCGHGAASPVASTPSTQSVGHLRAHAERGNEVPRPRTGISLTEVLIAMGILTLGLLGVAAIFPVGGFYMQKAEISDRGSAIAQSVMSDIVAKGFLNPRTWMVMVPIPRTPLPGSWNSGVAADGRYSPAPVPAPQSGTFTRPFAESLDMALGQSLTATDKTLIGRQFGSAFVIDPLGVAAMAHPNSAAGNPQRNVVAYPFPSSALFVNYFPTPEWSSWLQGSQPTWPIRRVTFQRPTSGWQLDAEMASRNFQGNDDLATDLPDRDDRPAAQNWEIATVAGTSVPLARSWQGDYSWIVTVTPTTSAARDGMARDPESHAYDVSVVVFYKRVLPSGPGTTQADLPEIASNERAVKASVLSTGPNGGELLLTNIDTASTKSPFDELKTGQWIMVCGPHPASNSNDPRLSLNWYQVMAIDMEGNGIINNPTTQRVVALRGPQWPWLPAANLTATTDLSNNLCVGICRGAVAVHAKTLRLEGSRGSAWGSGLSLAVPPNSDPSIIAPK